MVGNITIGQYFPGDSVIHRVDPRVKILLIMADITFLFLCNNYVSLFIITAQILLFVAFSGVPFKIYIKSLKAVFIIVIFTSLLNLFYGSGEPIFKIGFLEITKAGINNSIFIAIRIIGLILISSVLTFTTPPTDLTDALERLMKPLKLFKIKVHEIAMMMTIALRFVPTLLEETDKIMSAQKARGANIESGNLIQRVKALTPIFVPLFISSFRRAYDLALAMECRCYKGGDGQTRMKVLKITNVDVIITIATIVICLGVILCNVNLPATIR